MWKIGIPNDYYYFESDMWFNFSSKTSYTVALEETEDILGFTFSFSYFTLGYSNDVVYFDETLLIGFCRCTSWLVVDWCFQYSQYGACLLYTSRCV